MCTAIKSLKYNGIGEQKDGKITEIFTTIFAITKWQLLLCVRVSIDWEDW